MDREDAAERVARDLREARQTITLLVRENQQLRNLLARCTKGLEEIGATTDDEW